MLLIKIIITILINVAIFGLGFWNLFNVAKAYPKPEWYHVVPTIIIMGICMFAGIYATDTFID